MEQQAIRPKLNSKGRDFPIDYASCININTSLSPVEEAALIPIDA